VDLWDDLSIYSVLLGNDRSSRCCRFLKHFLLIEVEDLMVRSHVTLEAKVSHKDLQKRSFSDVSVLCSVHSSGISLMFDDLFKYSAVGGRKVGIRRNTSQVERPTRH
jgi:hypothetical protein